MESPAGRGGCHRGDPAGGHDRGPARTGSRDRRDTARRTARRHVLGGGDPAGARPADADLLPALSRAALKTAAGNAYLVLGALPEHRHRLVPASAPRPPRLGLKTPDLLGASDVPNRGCTAVHPE